MFVASVVGLVVLFCCLRSSLSLMQRRCTDGPFISLGVFGSAISYVMYICLSAIVSLLVNC